MFDVMTRLEIHNMAEGGTPQVCIAELCGTSLRSVERILTEAAPTRDEMIAGERHGAKRQGRPPKADAAMIERIRLLLESPGNDRLPATEGLRRTAEWGYTGGRNQMTELVKRLRPKPRQASTACPPSTRSSTSVNARSSSPRPGRSVSSSLSRA